MNGLRRTVVTGMALLSAVCVPAAAQDRATDETGLRAADAAFWAAFNACDAAAMARFFTPDVEFYHDRTGLTHTRSAVVRSLVKGPCGTPGLHVRRELVADSLRYDPVPRTGAILTGEHRFYAREGGGAERLDGQASFAVVWVHEGADWRMRRVLSFAHRPAR